MTLEERQTRPAGGRNRRLLAVLVGLLVAAMVVAVIWYVGFGPGQAGGPPGSTVAELSGNADLESETFFVRTGWQIHWETEGERFEYAIEGDRSIGTVISQEGPGSGITSPVPAGNFRIIVQADGPWRIQVVQGN